MRDLVDHRWLAARLDHPAVRIVDCRWRGDGSGAARFASGHLPGAVHVDWSRELRTSGPLPRGLPALDELAALFGRLGIDRETTVVAYADEDYSGAARLWWALRFAGHERVVILDGGIDQWMAAGRPLTQEISAPPPRTFIPRPRPALRVTTEEVAAALGQPGVAIVDTRPLEQFAGQAVWSPLGSCFPKPGEERVTVGGVAIRLGRIPRARHLVSSSLVDPTTWRYLPPAAIRARARAAGIRPDDRVITYCGVGISASRVLFALRLAGWEDVALYDASWEAWGADPSLPLERDG
jgi:thiosulfate/3-mercaptopyruvate sulfurtransferase